jgi:hypothetical protein
MPLGQQPGQAWVLNKKKTKWVKPPAPKSYVDSSGNTVTYAWDNNKGWVSNSAQAAAWNVPLSIIKSDPELDKLFQDAWNSQKKGAEWSQAEFTVKLQATNWYKNASEAQRKYYLLSKDPAQKQEFEKQLSVSRASVEDAAAGIGATLSEDELNTIADDALRLGYSDAQLKNALAAHISYQNKSGQDVINSLYGEAGKVENDIRSTARDYGVLVSDSWVLNQVRAVESGGKSDYKDEIIDMSKNQYSQWADKISADKSLEYLANGFKQSYANEMDVDIASLDVTHPAIQKAMAQTNGSNQPISQDDYRKQLRQTDEWSNVTKNKDNLMATGQAILKKMGFM